MSLSKWALPFQCPRGLRGIFIIWFGQMVSGTASAIAFFALPAWILSNTESSGNALGSWESLYFASYLVVILFAGVFVDRYPLKAMMLVYDVLSLIAAVLLLVFERAGILSIWHLYLAGILQGIGYAFQSPSYSAAITTMVSKKYFVRANGFLALLDSAPGIIGAPPCRISVSIHRVGWHPDCQPALVCGFYHSVVDRRCGLLLLLPTIEPLTCTSPRIIHAVTFLSVISYAIYLINRSVILYPLILPFKPVFASYIVLTLGTYVGYVILVMLIAYAFYRFVEQPILAFRDKLDIKKGQ